jgi:hypothetical protein
MKFKIGDKVRVIGIVEFADGSSDEYIGQDGRVANIDGSDIPYLVELPEVSFYFGESSLELMPEFEAGDVVSAWDGYSWRSLPYLFSASGKEYCLEIGKGKDLADGKCVYAVPYKKVMPVREPQIEIIAKINGKTVPLKDISEDTLKKIREAE